MCENYNTLMNNIKTFVEARGSEYTMGYDGEEYDADEFMLDLKDYLDNPHEWRKFTEDGGARLMHVSEIEEGIEYARVVANNTKIDPHTKKFYSSQFEIYEQALRTKGGIHK